MLSPWLIDQLRKEKDEQARRDRESWDNQPRVEVDDVFRRPPVAHAPEGDGRVDGGIVTIDFTI